MECLFSRLLESIIFVKVIRIIQIRHCMESGFRWFGGPSLRGAIFSRVDVASTFLPVAAFLGSNLCRQKGCCLSVHEGLLSAILIRRVQRTLERVEST